MSLALLDKERRVQPGVTIYLSTDGSGGFPIKGLKPILQNGGNVVAAFDADQAGELMAWRLAQQLPGVERLTPGQGKDWNEKLMHPEQSGKVVHPAASQNQMKQLWQWHLAATALGRPEAYLARITEVAKESAKGASLSEKAASAMTRDMAQFAQSLRNSKDMQKSIYISEFEEESDRNSGIL
jgi:DNA primase